MVKRKFIITIVGFIIIHVFCVHIEVPIVLGSKHWLLRPFWLVKWSFSHMVGPCHVREKKAAWQHRKAFAILTDTSAWKTTQANTKWHEVVFVLVVMEEVVDKQLPRNSHERRLRGSRSVLPSILRQASLMSVNFAILHLKNLAVQVVFLSSTENEG